MAKKVETVRREMREESITHFHVYVGSHPARTFEDEALAQHYAIDEKARLVRQGCDLSSPEFLVRVEEETKSRQVTEVVAV